MDNSKIVFHSLEEVVQAAFGESAVILRSDSIPGGDINDAYRVTLSDGKKIFVKMNLTGNLNFFLTEAGGLEALGSSGKIKVPEVLGYGIDERRGRSFLAMEYIESAPRTEAYWERFGHQLAELHRAECGLFVNPEDENQKYGFQRNIISERVRRRMILQKDGSSSTGNAGSCRRSEGRRDILTFP